MLKKIVYAALVSGLALPSMSAFSDDAFLKDRSNDYGVRVAGSDQESPFPEDNSKDYGIRLAGSDQNSPFPEDNSNDYGSAVASGDSAQAARTNSSTSAQFRSAGSPRW